MTFNQGDKVRGTRTNEVYRVEFGPYGNDESYAVTDTVSGRGGRVSARNLEPIPAPDTPREAAAKALHAERTGADVDWACIPELARENWRGAANAAVDAYLNAEQPAQRGPLKIGDRVRVLRTDALRFYHFEVGDTPTVTLATPDEDNEIQVRANDTSDYLPANGEGVSWERV